MMEEFLIARLLRPASPTFPVVGEKVNWLERPSGEALPAVTLSLAHGGEDYHHEGRVDLTYARLQAECWGRTYLEAKQVSRVTIQEMEQAYENDDVSFDEALVINDFDRKPENLPGGTRVFSVVLEFNMPYKLKGA